jgi:hypothetical protein
MAYISLSFLFIGFPVLQYDSVQLWVPGEVLTVSAGAGAPEISVQTSLPPRVPLIVPAKEVLPMNQVSFACYFILSSNCRWGECYPAPSATWAMQQQHLIQRRTNTMLQCEQLGCSF